jgi:hypothetical protein
MDEKIIDTLLAASKDLHLAVENLGQAVEAIKEVLIQEQRRTGGPMIVCNFCRGAGQLRTAGKILDPCPYCGGSGNIDRNILNPTLEIQTWRLTGAEGKDLGHGVTIEVKHMDPGNKLGVLFMLEKATDLVEKGQMIQSDAQIH